MNTHHKPLVPANPLIAPDRLFTIPYTVAQNAPYFLTTVDRKPDGAGGVLRCGQVVWLEHPLEKKSPQPKVLGFAEAVGLIYLSPMWLRHLSPLPDNKADHIPGRKTQEAP